MSETTVPDSVRSRARRRAGFRLEKAHPVLTREYRRGYDTPSYRARWGKKFHARRTEQIRADLIRKYPREYEKLLQEELKNERNWR